MQVIEPSLQFDLEGPPAPIRQADLARFIEDSVNEVYVIDRTTLRFLDVNRAARENLGYTMAELAAMTPADLRLDRSFPALRARLEPLSTGARPKVVFESVHGRRDGSRYPVEIHLQPGTYGGAPVYIAFALDLTERRCAAKHIAEQARLLDLIFSHILDPFALLDKDYTYLRVSDSYAQAARRGSAEFIGRNHFALYPMAEAEIKEARLAKTTYRYQEHPCIVPDHPEWGTTYWDLSVVPILDGRGEVELFLFTLKDVTERRRAEEERRGLEAQVRHAQKLESLGVMAGGIAHDFNNLLTNILGYADLARLTSPAGSPARRYLEEAMKGVARAAELTQQMLAYAGKGHFAVRPLDLSALVTDMSRLLEVSVTKRCVLQYQVASGLPAVDADAAQLRQVLMNLLINASEALGEAGGVIQVGTGVEDCDRSALASACFDDQLPEGPYVSLTVRDAGCGMTEETKARIFDPFFTTKFTGRGLGLAAVLGIVRGHRGAIKVSSAPGAGTTFKVLLPASRSAAPIEAAPKDEAPGWRGHGLVLLVEDEVSVRSVAGEMLRQLGFEVLTAGDGREGVEAFRRAAGQVRLVILDLTMPNLDGEEAFREMQRIRGDVRAILSSGYNGEMATKRLLPLGLAGFLKKPYSLEELAAMVRKVLGSEAPGSTNAAAPGAHLTARE